MGLLDKILNSTTGRATGSENVVHQGLLKKALSSINIEPENSIEETSVGTPDMGPEDNISGPESVTGFYPSNENSLSNNEEPFEPEAQIMQYQGETNTAPLPCHSLLRTAEKFLSTTGIQEAEDVLYPVESVAERNDEPAYEEKNQEGQKTEKIPEQMDFDQDALYSDTAPLDFSKMEPTGSPVSEIYGVLDFISSQCNAEKIALVTVGELSPETGRINFSKNLDTTTIERFCPDITFLNGLTETNIFTGIPDLNFFTGFFSSREYNSLKGIYVLKVNNGWLFFIDSYLSVNQINLKKIENSTDEIIKNLVIPFDLTSSFVNTNINIKNSTSLHMFVSSAIDDGMVCNLFKLNFNRFLNNFKQRFEISELINLYNEVLSKIKLTVGNGGIVNKLDDFNFIICLFSKQQLDSELFLQQLETSLTPYLGSVYTNYFELIKTETTNDKQKIISCISKGF